MKTTGLTDSGDLPSGQVSLRDFATGAGTAQFATSTTEELEIGDVFKWINPSAAAFYFYVDSVQRTERKGEETKQPFTTREAINPTTFKVTAAGFAESAALDLTLLT